MSFKSEIISNINNYFDNINESSIKELTEEIIKYKNNGIYFLGIGKSYNICLQFSDLLNCISFNSFVLNSSNILHGNLGCLKNNNLILVVSNSGNTFELINILNIIKNEKKCKIILLSSKKGKLSEYSDKNILIPIKNELSTCFSLIPTNSIMIYILFMNNILKNIIKKENIDKKKYIKNHSSGNIGFLYKKIKDIMTKREHCCILNSEKSLLYTIKEMNKKQIGIAIIENEGIIEGIITNRDVCQYIENNNINSNIKKIINKNYYYIENEELYLKDIQKDYLYVPIIKNKKLIGIFDRSNYKFNNIC
jgi:arabinose-5-phosphate isomerase